MNNAQRNSSPEKQLDRLELPCPIIGFGLPFNEVIGRPRDMRVCDLPLPLAATMLGRSIEVRIRH
jgi:hypothetical protein